MGALEKNSSKQWQPYLSIALFPLNLLLSYLKANPRSVSHQLEYHICGCFTHAAMLP